ncbi:MAG: DNA cytosine methyltransferase [Elusimicrobia bacterium]|nr:DNA cytosine methyltransferase [Elusimicrobiota bacterium]
MTKKIKLLSLFAGCGGLDWGFHEAGYEVVWANDFEKNACETFKKNLGDVIKCGDITAIDPYTDKTIPECDIITGGFPCQDFSVIWKRPGLEGKRGNLYKSFLRFIDAKKPKAFVAENVKGLLSANNGKAIEQIVRDFESIAPGYVVKPKLYNFADFGVPQFRERILIIGIRVDTGFDFKHPAETHGPGRANPYVTTGAALEGAEKAKHNNEKINIAPKTVDLLKLILEGGNFTDIPKNNPLYVKGMISHVYRRIDRKQPAKTIIAAGGGGTWGYHYPEPRPLTNRERARIQSFPDKFVFSGSIAEVRRQIGNAVPPQGVVEVAKALKPLFSGKFKKVNLTEQLAELKNKPVKERLSDIVKEAGK